MAELTEQDQEIYGQLKSIVEREQSEQPATNEEKDELIWRLRELADRTDDFDPDNLDNIIAFTQNISGNYYAEAILNRAREQKNRLNSQNPSVEELNISVSLDEELDNQNITVEENTLLTGNEFTGPTLQDFESQAPLITQPSYNLLQMHDYLLHKEDRTPEEQEQLADIEQQVEQILRNTDRDSIDDENAVAIRDYLDISNASENLTDEQKQRNDELSEITDEKLREYDYTHSLEDIEELTPKQLEENANAWAEISQSCFRNNINDLANILNECPPEVQEATNDLIQKVTITGLKHHTPEGNENDHNTFFNAIENNEAELVALINTEYLKREAMEEFCAQNNITAEKLDEILNSSARGIALSDEDQNLKQSFDLHLQQHLEKFPDFHGPYSNHRNLAQAITVANGLMIDRVTTLDSRIARKVNAPGISIQINKINKKFSEKHPKLATGLKFAKTLGLNIAKTAAIGAVLGPVGLTAYSAFKTAKTIRNSYKRYKEQNEGNFKSFLKHLTKRENRAELLTLTGQIAATAISGYFTGAAGLENLDLGMAGQAMGHTNGHLAEAASQAAQNAGHSVGGFFQAGFEKIMNSPRRAVLMASSLGIGTVKFLSEKSNQRFARKNLKATLQKLGVDLDKKELRNLEKFDSKEQFMEKLSALIPEMPEELKDEAFKYAEMAKKANPKTAFIGAASGAVIGLAVASATEYMHDNGGEHTPESPDSPAPDEHHTTTPEVSAADNAWANDDAAARRFESFGIDAKNANEMLREMGVIKEGDNHFYRQSELARLVNGSNLSDEQKATIQAWADDRDARVANLQAWQAAHPTHHTVHTTANDTASNSATTTNMPQVETPQSATPETPAGTPTETTTQEEITKQRYHVQGRIDRLRNLQGNVEATNPIAAAQTFHQEHDLKLQRSSKLTITDEDGDRTVLKTRIGHHRETTTVTQYDDDEKISTQKTRFYKDGYSTTKLKADLDGDGKKDTVVTTTGENGASVTMTTLSSGERRVQVTQADGSTVTNSTQDLEARGMSHREAKRAVKWSYNDISRELKGRD